MLSTLNRIQKYTIYKPTLLKLEQIYKKNHRTYTVTEVKKIGDKIMESGTYIKNKVILG